MSRGLLAQALAAGAYAPIVIGLLSRWDTLRVTKCQSVLDRFVETVVSQFLIAARVAANVLPNVGNRPHAKGMISNYDHQLQPDRTGK